MKNLLRDHLDFFLTSLIFIVIVILAIIFPYSSSSGIIFVRSKVVDSCTDCSGTKKFAWHMENTTITSGTPCGCTDGADTTMSSSGSPTLSTSNNTDGTYSLNINATERYYLDITDESELDINDFKVTFDIYIDSYPDNEGNGYFEIWSWWGDSNDYVRVRLNAAATPDRIDFQVNKNGTERTESVNAAVDTAYSCEVQHKVADGNDMYIACGALTDEGDRDVGDTTPDGFDELFFGNRFGTALTNADVYIDNFHIDVCDRY